MTKQLAFSKPIALGGNKRNLRTQFGALCYRVVNEKTQILLVTSRSKSRWIIPKGWPMAKASPPDCAMTEAWEEAGVKGKVKPVCLGVYAYTKDLGPGKTLPCMVAVFPIKVRRLQDNYPERKERRRKWFSPKKAAKRVSEPELRALLQNFDPNQV